MATLDKIKNRIGSVKSTSKITKAMELVATAKIKKAREKFDKTKEYYQTVINNVADISSNIENSKLRYLSQQEGKTIWIVLSSDLGLCGGYNVHNVKKLREEYKNNDAVFGVGLKSQSLSRTYNIEIEKGYSQIIGSFSVENASDIVEDVLELFNSDTSYTNIKLIASEFINNATFNPQVTNLVPISVENLNVEQKEKSKAYSTTLFEQSPEEIVNQFVPMFLTFALYAKVNEAKLIEQASRRLAMEAATKNATELLDELKIQYNQQRQANITQEISEIIAGSNS